MNSPCNKKTFMAGIMICMLSVFPLAAQQGDGGTRPILHEVGASARAFGLGRAFTALADDPTAVYWNPAGLEFAPKIALSLFHTPLIVEGASYDFLGFVYPTIGFGSLGVGLSRIGVDGITYTNEENGVINPDNPATFDYIELYIAYAKKLPFNISSGLTFKLQRQQFAIANNVNSSFGFDFGLLYRPQSDSPLLRGVSVGFQFQNLVKQQLKLGPNDDEIAYEARLGIMKSIPVGPEAKLNFLMDYAQGEYDGGSIHFGSEYVFREMGTLRLGFDENTPTFGAGVTYRFMQIDYSFGNLSYESDFPATHRFSITFNLGLSREEKLSIATKDREDRERQLVSDTREEERLGRVDVHMKKGDEYLAAGQYFDAYSEYQQVIALAPFDRAAKEKFTLAKTQIEQQFEQRQADAIAEAIDKNLAEENRKFVEIHFQQGQAYLNNKSFTEALIEFNLALERAPDDPLITEAINTTTRRLNAEVRNLLTTAREKFRSGEYSDALNLLSDARVLAPDAAELKDEIRTLTNRIKLQRITIDGLAYLELGENEKAKAKFEEGLQLDPANESIKRYLEIARGKINVGDSKMDPQSERLHNEATAHFIAGRYQQALEIWRALAQEYPYNKKVQDAIKTAEDRLKRANDQ